MFEHWDSFYLLVGGAGGGLIGLVFIVITLIRGVNAETNLRSASVFMSPLVFNLAMVLVMSAFATATDLTPAAVSLILGAGALTGILWSGRVIVLLGFSKVVRAPHWTDIWAYGVIPLGAYLALAATAASASLAPIWAPLLLAFSLTVLLLSAVRNAWDLVTWITAKGDQLGKD
jgi:hypothetical protein